MIGMILLGALGVAALAVLILVPYALIRDRRRGIDRPRRAAAIGGVETGILTDGAHTSHSHIDCSAHSVDCGGHGGH
jgi:hypothetical protein